MGRQKILNLMVESFPKFKLFLFWELKVSEINVVEGSSILIFQDQAAKQSYIACSWIAWP